MPIRDMSGMSFTEHGEREGFKGRHVLWEFNVAQEAVKHSTQFFCVLTHIRCRIHSQQSCRLSKLD
jgi:hypothetical protein